MPRPVSEGLVRCSYVVQCDWAYRFGHRRVVALAIDALGALACSLVFSLSTTRASSVLAAFMGDVAPFQAVVALRRPSTFAVRFASESVLSEAHAFSGQFVGPFNAGNPA